MTLLGIFLLTILLLLWNIDFIASILNIKSLQPDLPKGLKDVFDQDTYAKSQKYTAETEKFGIITSIVSLMTLLAFWIIGGFGFLDTYINNLGYNYLITGILYILTLIAAQWVLGIPASLYKTFVIEEKFGFNKTTIATFISDQVKGIIIGAVIGVPILAFLLWVFNSFELAWLWAWIGFTVIQLLLMYLAPTYIMPLFNKFEPMPDGELKTEIELMAKKCSFPLTELFIMDGSKRSGKSNAFFTGFGKNKKIALFDTLIEKHTNEELVAILAHEIGHFKLKHIVKHIVFAILQTSVLFFLLSLILNESYSFNVSIFETFYIKEQSIHTGFVIFMLLFSPVSKILSIVGHKRSRKHEFEADAYAANAQGSSKHLISGLKKLSAHNLSNLTPHWLTVFLDYSHPPVTARITALESIEKEKQ